jgi:hypothetical protein
MRTLAIPVMLLAAAAAAPASADSFRCGSWIATTDLTVPELVEKCGAPAEKTVEVVEVRGPNVRGAGNVKRGTATIERWTYDRGTQSFAMVVTIEDGRIKSIERKR